ncbi:ubiquinone biosynthesis accessory factor UbiJ [Alteromonas halophila]|uniref:Ubiquinone biosynthesis accessory factor UbiJ n=1 Tax=Alteromonas halophila TaxID=516698 RepID=A0A918JK44_9ALTE|nr:SCP2 sterol-binding domain-containing protein [Alteromonas halophila]GGW82705.1 hypothetical protein GCM10007391_14770 [Alteromonas halophila]
MPAAALVTAAIETAINKLINLDPDTPARLRPLAGNRLYLFISPLPQGLCLVFSDRIDVLAVDESVTEVVAELPGNACCIETELATLPSLTNTNELTRLIQQKKLNVEGELSVAQKVSALFRSLDIDLEEQLARYTNDVVAHEAGTLVRQFTDAFRRQARHTEAALGNALVEEKRIAAHRLAVVHFSDEVAALRDDVARANARLERLETRVKKK